jgi:GT2 family glycosyltransferase
MIPISIIMPCYNRAYDLLNVLQAYDRQKVDEPFELIAIDDASKDETYNVLTSFCPTQYTIRVERMEKNRGPAAARNRGIALAASPLLLIVGDDIVPDHNLVQGHISAHRRHSQEETAILGRVVWPKDLTRNTLMTHIDGIGAQQFSYHYLQDGKVYDFRHFYTANISIRTEFLKSLKHWFDPNFRYAAFEDAELAFRLSKHGLRILYLSSLVGYHYHHHNIWTFSKRQRNSGLMASVITKKHPTLNFTFRAQYYRILNVLKRPKTILLPYTSEEMDWLEEIACRLVSFYEWKLNRLLDRLYLAVLDYFYYDGLIQGIFKEAKLSARIRAAHARCYLTPTLTWFLEEATRLGIPLPDGYDPGLINRLSQRTFQS